MQPWQLTEYRSDEIRAMLTHAHALREARAGQQAGAGLAAFAEGDE